MNCADPIQALSVTTVLQWMHFQGVTGNTSAPEYSQEWQQSNLGVALVLTVRKDPPVVIQPQCLQMLQLTQGIRQLCQFIVASSK